MPIYEVSNKNLDSKIVTCRTVTCKKKTSVYFMYTVITHIKKLFGDEYYIVIRDQSFISELVI